jgi:hypothetical protein
MNKFKKNTILFILLIILIIIVIYYIYFKNIEKFQITQCTIICNNYNKQKFIFDLYSNITTNLTPIIKNLNNLQDPSLRNVTESLNNINTRISQLLPAVTKNYNNTSLFVKKYNCKCLIIESFQSNQPKQIIIPVTAGDNIFLSMLYLKANVNIYSKSIKKIDLFISTCIGISNSIKSLIKNITTNDVTYIIGNNFGALINSLNIANSGVIANIKYGDTLITTYIYNIKNIICEITNDPTYISIIHSMNQSRKTKFINSFIDILKINTINYPNMDNQNINNFNTTIQKNIGINNILDFNKFNCKK